MKIQQVKTELLHAEWTDRQTDNDEAVHNSVIVTNKAEIL